MKTGKIIKAWLSAVLILFISGACGCERSKTDVNTSLPDGAFKAKITFENPPDSVKAGSDFFVSVQLKNISNAPWPSQNEKYSINLSYHWLDKTGKTIAWEGRRTGLSNDLKPNDEAPLKASVKAPDQPGDYILAFDMVQENVSWFQMKGSTPGTLNLKVK